MIRTIILAAVLCCTIPVFGQLEAGIMGGISFYHGDLSSDNFFNSFSRTGAMGGAFARYGFSEYLTAKFAINYGRISGDDADYDNPRNLHFRSHVLEFGLTAEWNIMGYHPYNLYKVFSPYLFGGIAITSFKPQAELDDEWINLQSLGTEGQGMVEFPERKPYSLSDIAFPIGLGFKYAINDKLNVGIEAGVRITLTDYLDDVSTTYVNTALLAQSNGELAAALSNRSGREVQTGDPRGNPDDNDNYFMAGITVSYNFSDNGLVGSRGKTRGKGCYK